MESTYKILMMISAVVLILLSVILATNKLPKTPRFRKVRMTQVLLIIAFSSLGIMNILCFIKGYHPEIESFITLIISLYQAFLLSSTMTVLIRPDYIRWKYLLTNLAVITAIVASMGIYTFSFRNITSGHSGYSQRYISSRWYYIRQLFFLPIMLQYVMPIHIMLTIMI